MTTIEDPRRLEAIAEAGGEGRAIDRVAAERAAAELLVAPDADLVDEQLRETQPRMVAAYAELLTPEPFRATTFANERSYDELVLVRRSVSLSLHASPAALSRRRTSRIPSRATDRGALETGTGGRAVARDVHLQERLTMQIADWVQEQLEPKGRRHGARSRTSVHVLRGAQKFGAKTVTSTLLVCEDPRTRQEFLAPTTRNDS